MGCREMAGRGREEKTVLNVEESGLKKESFRKASEYWL